MSRTELLLERIGALSGVAFIVAFIIGQVASGDSNSPNPDDPAAVIATYLTQNAVDQDLSISVSLFAIACLIVFVSYLRQVIQRAEGVPSFLSGITWAGGLLFAGTMLASLSIEIASSVLGAYGDDTQVAKTLYVLSWDFVYVFGPPLAALVGATSTAGLMYGVVPRWLCWSGIPLAAILLTPLMFVGLVLSIIWLAALSVTLTFRTIRMPSSEMVPHPA